MEGIEADRTAGRAQVAGTDEVGLLEVARPRRLWRGIRRARALERAVLRPMARAAGALEDSLDRASRRARFDALELEFPGNGIGAAAGEALAAATAGEAIACLKHHAHDTHRRGRWVRAMRTRDVAQACHPGLLEPAAPLGQPLSTAAQLAQDLTGPAPLLQQLHRPPASLLLIHRTPPRRSSPSRRMSAMMWRFVVSDDLSATP
jgi:hypothetical protein